MKTERPQVGDVWHRVNGSWTGEYIADGVELAWEEWCVARLTPRGCWLQCLTWSYRKQRFALDTSSRFASPTKSGALMQLIRRKRRHLAILESQKTEAELTLALALEAHTMEQP